MNFAVLQFPASNCDQDAVHALAGPLGHAARLVWHKEDSLEGFDAVIIPGGFSYGDYLRTGAIARFSPIMGAVRRFVEEGKPVLGICNGFQILCEAGLLPGALLRNRDLQFHCEHVFVNTISRESRFSAGIPQGKILRLPIAHGEGCYYADEQTLRDLRENGQVLWEYCDAQGEATAASNPNGSLGNIAGIRSRKGNVAGLMPHPERACEAILGSDDGRLIFESLIASLAEAPAAA